jgi:hypothetical protein
VSKRQQEAWGGEVQMPRWLRRVLRRPEPSEPTPQAAREARKPQSGRSAGHVDGSALGPMTDVYDGGSAARRGKRR